MFWQKVSAASILHFLEGNCAFNWKTKFYGIYHNVMHALSLETSKTFFHKFFITQGADFNPKTAGRGGQFDLPPYGFSKNVSSKEGVKPSFFVTSNIILKHIFPENFVEFTQVVQKI